jgi:hypothetical protein
MGIEGWRRKAQDRALCSTGCQRSRRAIAPSDDDDDDLLNAALNDILLYLSILFSYAIYNHNTSIKYKHLSSNTFFFSVCQQ